MKDFFEELFVYNYEENETLIKLIKNTENVPTRVLQLISHILLVHQSWNQRLLHQEGLGDFWEVMPASLLQSENARVYNLSQNIISNSEINGSLEYKNSKGIRFKNTYKDILFHIINHGTHHRGQVNTHLRNGGIEPVILDYIFFKR